MNRRDEVDVIHGSSDDMGAGVTIGRYGAHQVNVVHEPPAEQITQRIGVIRQDQFRHLRPRVSNFAGRKRRFDTLHRIQCRQLRP
jgi:hypothetical protein